MGFSRIADIVSAASNRMTTRLAAPEHKNNTTRFSSLQDFSTYGGPDQENDDIEVRNDRRYTMLPRLLERENGGGSSFSKERIPLGNSVIRKKWIRGMIFALGVFVLLVLILLCVRYVSNHLSQEALRYYVVLDCGSTGSRVYVYESSIDYRKDSSLPIVLRSLPKEVKRVSKSQSGRAYHRMETEPGLDKLVHNISALRGAIGPLLQWAEEKIPKKAHKNTFIFLYATAGVRRLQHSHSRWILKNAWSILRNSSFVCRRERVKIITGMEEAYYGWVALNYHMGVLGSIPSRTTYGSLDLGGSSLQVTFETKELVQDQTSLNLSIGEVKHHLNAYSLSGYGLNDAFDRSVVHLLKRLPGITKADLVSGNIELKHPCLQTGYKEKYVCSHCASVSQKGRSPLIGDRCMGKGAKYGLAVELVGAPHWEECSAVAKITVNLSEWSNLNQGINCEVQPCALGASLPRPHGQFFAMSGFFVVFQFFNLTSEATLEDVLQKGQAFCAKTWHIAKSSVNPQPFIEQYCFRAPYVVSLLREGLHIVDGQVAIGSGRITWTLGVALLEAGAALSTGLDIHGYRILQIKMHPTVLFIMVFMSLIFLICAISCVGNWIPRFFHRAYLPLFRSNSATTTLPSPFTFQRWSPINSGDARTKMPLSPVAGSQNKLFSVGPGLGNKIQLMEYSIHASNGSVSHSYSSGSLKQMYSENNGLDSFWTPNRGQMRLQSRRSQSREDLSSSLAEAHFAKV